MIYIFNINQLNQPLNLHYKFFLYVYIEKHPPKKTEKNRKTGKTEKIYFLEFFSIYANAHLKGAHI